MLQHNDLLGSISIPGAYGLGAPTTPSGNRLLQGLEAHAFWAYRENLVPVQAAMASHVFRDGYVVTVCFTYPDVYEYSFGGSLDGLRGPYPTRALCLFDIEARLAQEIS